MTYVYVCGGVGVWVGVDVWGCVSIMSDANDLDLSSRSQWSSTIETESIFFSELFSDHVETS